MVCAFSAWLMGRATAPSWIIINYFWRTFRVFLSMGIRKRSIIIRVGMLGYRAEMDWPSSRRLLWKVEKYRNIYRQKMYVYFQFYQTAFRCENDVGTRYEPVVTVIWNVGGGGGQISYSIIKSNRRHSYRVIGFCCARVCMCLTIYTSHVRVAIFIVPCPLLNFWYHYRTVRYDS